MNRDEYIKNYRQRYGPESVQAPGESNITPISAISTGSVELDSALGVGGVPVGRLTELYGPESSGKTTLCYEIMAACQAGGGSVAMIDAEHSADPQYAEAIGVEWNAVTFVQPDYGEAGLEFVSGAAKHGVYDLIIVDSVAALTPKVIVDGEVGDHTVGAHPRLMAQAVTKIAPSALKSNTTVVFTNQLREKIGVVYGSPETQPGGRTLRFMASVRMDIRRIETIGVGDNSTANKVRVKVVKNKVAPPNRTAEFEIEYGTGINKLAGLLKLAVERNVVDLAGTRYYTFPTKQKFGSKSDALRYLTDHPKTVADLRQKVLEAAE